MAKPDEERRILRARFEEDSELYDRVRPSYPSELFADLMALGGLAAGMRVLEIGSGTGQATESLLDLGLEVICVELGQSMVAAAQRRLSGRPGVRFVNATFEEYELPSEPFDAVLAFTAWHWLDPQTRTVKAAEALRDGGALITVATQHVRGGSEQFFEEVNACYERWDSTTPEGLTLLRGAEVPPQRDELNESDRFSESVYRRYEWMLRYSTQEYLELLKSYSTHRNLPAERLEGLLACIGDLIETRYDSEVVKRYFNELRVNRLA